MGRMNVREISEGLIAVLEEEEGLYLYEIMDRHESLGILVPGVACPCDSMPGDEDDHLFILGFLEVLKHHVGLRQIDGGPKDQEQGEIWDQWVRGELRARRFSRPRDRVDPSCEEIRPKKFQRIAQIPLKLSDETWRRLQADEETAIIHLDYVESRLFSEGEN